jgi:hypothetical protein
VEKINKKIILSKIEQNICSVISEFRHLNNRNNNIKNSKMGKKSDQEMDLEGISAEFAFCKLFNLYPDLTIDIRSSINETDNGDATLPSGHTVDVKVTHHLNGKLIAVPWKKANVDLFALIVGKSPEYTFKGFMKSKELLKDSRLGDLGYGKTYIAEQNELKEFKDL